MANLTDENGVTHTPEELAAEAVANVVIETEADTTVSAELDQVARYFNKQLLSNARSPEKMWKSNQETWRNDAVIKLIRDKAKTIDSYIQAIERKNEATEALVKQYIAEGMTSTEARKKATGKQ